MNLRPALLAAAALAAALGSCLALCDWGAGGDRDLAGLARARTPQGPAPAAGPKPSPAP
jgi:hypothetical protein